MMQLSATAKRWLMLVSCIYLAACSVLTPKFERPTLSVVGIDLAGGNLLQQNFRVRFHIQNPNDRALPVKGLQAAVNLSGDQIASGVNDHAFVVPAMGELDFDMIVTANLGMALLKLANQRNQSSDAIDYEVTGSASIDLPFLRDLPFRQAGSFSLNRSR